MIELTDEMKAAVKRRMGVPDGQELDPWMGSAIEDVLAIVDPSPAWATRIRDADDCIWTRVPDAPMVWWHENPIFGNRTAADIVRTCGPVEWLP